MRRFGPYQTIADLGRGGMADLYLARSESEPGRPLCILKTMRAPVNERKAAMFRDEARLGMLLEHPNIVHTIGSGDEEGAPFIALEFLDGQPLDRVLKRAPADSRLRTMLAWSLGESLAGLQHAHELTSEGEPLAIIHRDFSPPNIFLTYDGRTKVLDFGIAKSTGRAHRTSVGDFKGKLRYMAPEQALGMRIDRRADLFAAGVILWEIWAGSPLWKKELSDHNVFNELVGGMYPTEIEGAPAAINGVLSRALDRDSTRRFRTAEEMRQELLRALDAGTPSLSLLPELFQDERARTAAIIAEADAARATGVSLKDRIS